MTYLWYISNIGIAVGYYVLALSLYKLLAQFMPINWQIQYGAAAFFLTCSLTHAEHAYHLYAEPDESVKVVLLAFHSVAIHVVQVVAVWTFLWGVLKALRTTRELDHQTAAQLHAAIEERVMTGERRHPPNRRHT